MKYDPQKTNKRLAGTPAEKRVFIYNADIILEFLNATFVPVKHFLKPDVVVKADELLSYDHFIDGKKVVTEYAMTFDELYKLYLTFRNYKDYTSEIETRFRFGVIIGKMRLYKNGWEFIKRRSTRRQTLVVGPMVLRSRFNEPLEPVEKKHDLEKAQVVDDDPYAGMVDPDTLED